MKLGLSVITHELFFLTLFDNDYDIPRVHIAICCSGCLVQTPRGFVGQMAVTKNTGDYIPDIV